MSWLIVGFGHGGHGGVVGGGVLLDTIYFPPIKLWQVDMWCL